MNKKLLYIFIKNKIANKRHKKTNQPQHSNRFGQVYFFKIIFFKVYFCHILFNNIINQENLLYVFLGFTFLGKDTKFILIFLV